MIGILYTTKNKVGDALKWLADHRLFVMGFGVMVAFWPTMLSPTYTPRWAAIAVLVPLCCKLDPRDIPASLRWVFIVVLTAGFMATRWASPDPMGGYLEMMFVVMLGLAFIAGANLESLDEVMDGVGAGLAVSVFVSLYQLSTASDQGRDGLFGAPPIGMFGNSEVFAELAALVFVWAAARPRIIVASIAALPLLLCNSRIAIFSALAGLLFAYGPKSKLRMAAAVIGLVIAGMSLVFIFGSGKVMSADHRLIIWTTTFLSWTQFGHGLGWFQASYPQEEFAHSDALQTIAEFGIAGFALLAIPFMAFKSNRGTNADRAVFFAVCIEIAFSFPLHMPASGFVAAIVAGFLVSRRPVVLLGSDLSGYEDGLRVRRSEASDFTAFGGGPRVGRAVPVRSLFKASARLRREVDRIDPGAAAGKL